MTKQYLLLSKKINDFPDSAGVYLMKDKTETILYVGKASSLKKRLKTYFQRPQSTKIQALLKRTKAIDYIQSASGAQALLLENILIKRHKPYYNAVLKDDKSYPYIKIKTGDAYPCLLIVRGKKDKKACYYGPYTNTKLLKGAIKALRVIFPFRSCLNLPKKPCLYLQLKLCPGVCVKKINKQAYRQNLKQLGLFLEGKYNQLLEELKVMMYQAAKNELFEQASLLRDRINSLNEIIFQTKEAKHSFEPSPNRNLKAHKLILKLQKALRLAKTPYRIEAFDISEIAGEAVVGAMVSFLDGYPDKNNYRKFKIKTVKGIDDYAMICEILRRRFSKAEKKGFALPDLVLIDGGKGHLTCALKELNNLKINNIPVIALAKRLESIYTSHILRKGLRYVPSSEVLNLAKDSEVLHLLQRIRDEVHRFAISYHRKLRQKNMRKSFLDAISGIGPRRKQNLLVHFGSIQAIKQASLEDLLKVKTIDR